MSRATRQAPRLTAPSRRAIGTQGKRFKERRPGCNAPNYFLPLPSAGRGIKGEGPQSRLPAFSNGRNYIRRKATSCPDCTAPLSTTARSARCVHALSPKSHPPRRSYGQKGKASPHRKICYSCFGETETAEGAFTSTNRPSGTVSRTRKCSGED